MTGSTNVLKSISWLTVGPLLRLLIGIPLAGFTAHYLGLVGYGEFSLALSLSVMFSALANLGLNDVLVREVAQRPEQSESLWTSVVAFKVALLAGYVALVAAIAWLLGYSSTLLWLVVLLSAMQGSLSLDNSARAVFLGQQRTRVLGMLDVAKVLVDTACTMSVLLLGYGTVMLAGVRFATAVGMIPVTLVVLMRYLHVHVRVPRVQPALSLLPSGLRFASATVIQSIYDRLGIVLVGHLLGAQAVALVSTATVFTEKLYWFLPSVQNAIFPFFSNLHVMARDRLDSAFARAFRYQVIIAVGCGLGMSLLGPWIISVIFPSKFWVAGTIVMIFGWVCVPRLIGNLLTTVLQSLGKEREVSRIVAAQCGLFLCTIMIFLHLWGLNGFAWAYLIAETTAGTLQAWVLTRMGILTDESLVSLFMTLGSGLAVFSLTAFLPPISDNLFGLLGLLTCYPLLLIVTRRISGEDMRYLHKLWAPEKPLTA
jgi:O-antigen/teichoic acid export membrane protein